MTQQAVIIQKAAVRSKEFHSPPGISTFIVSTASQGKPKPKGNSFLKAFPIALPCLFLLRTIHVIGWRGHAASLANPGNGWLEIVRLVT